ncbi:hypothetical protein DQG13_07800 [Paenibacillus sp. YN15]|nr:hypothetical protein DQG13_07800 [Paenibacillus sp. YN15]
MNPLLVLTKRSPRNRWMGGWMEGYGMPHDAKVHFFHGSAAETEGHHAKVQLNHADFSFWGGFKRKLVHFCIMRAKKRARG